MINIKPNNRILDYCNSCKSRDTDDPRNIEFIIGENNVGFLLTLCKACRKELVEKIIQHDEFE